MPARGVVPMSLRLSCYLGVVTIAFALTLGLFAEVWSAERGNNPHDYSRQDECASCHEKPLPKLKFDSVTICTRCHSGYVGNHPVARHPLGERPKINISSLMPLSADGKMVCYTCHDNHNRSSYPNMLRTDYLRLCSSCHRGY